VSSVVVLDYGSGNIHSVTQALAAVGAEVTLSADPAVALAADGLVVPGVGAFAACLAQLRSVGGMEVIRDRIARERPVFGICVGHQVLFARGVEHGIDCPGIGVYPGTVRLLPTARLPHMGWNTLRTGETTLPGRFYFVHSYAALEATDVPGDATAYWSAHDGQPLVAAVRYGPVVSTQFHPEKSGSAGLRWLRDWVEALP